MHGNFITATKQLMGHAFVLRSADAAERARGRAHASDPACSKNATGRFGLTMLEKKKNHTQTRSLICFSDLELIGCWQRFRLCLLPSGGRLVCSCKLNYSSQTRSFR